MHAHIPARWFLPSLLVKRGKIVFEINVASVQDELWNEQKHLNTQLRVLAKPLRIQWTALHTAKITHCAQNNCSFWEPKNWSLLRKVAKSITQPEPHWVAQLKALKLLKLADLIMAALQVCRVFSEIQAPDSSWPLYNILYIGIGSFRGMQYRLALVLTHAQVISSSLRHLVLPINILI